jgi:hypothetical protein
MPIVLVDVGSKEGHQIVIAIFILCMSLLGQVTLKIMVNQLTLQVLFIKADAWFELICVFPNFYDMGSVFKHSQ